MSQTTKKLEEYLSRGLEEFELAALMMDGLEVAGQTVVVTLGITIDGTKVPLGIWLGSTENSRVCTAMLQNLLERGLRIDESILCVVDGGKGIRKALVDVLGISWSSKDANSTNSEIYARTFPSPVTPTCSRQ